MTSGEASLQGFPGGRGRLIAFIARSLFRRLLHSYSLSAAARSQVAVVLLGLRALPFTADSIERAGGVDEARRSEHRHRLPQEKRPV